MREKWLPIPSFEGQYEVSDQGRVRSVEREVVDVNGKIRRYQGLILQTAPNPGGYSCVRLGRGNPILVHYAVATAFIGIRPRGAQVRHLNGVKADNRKKNIRYGTPKQNQADRRTHGTHLCGEQTHTAVLTAKQVVRIKRILKTKNRPTHGNIAEKFGVTRPTITAIATGRNWAHVKV